MRINKDIIVTHHAKEEYLNDHPNESNPKKRLKQLYLKLKYIDWKNIDSYYKDNDREVVKVIYKGECLIYQRNVIITYYIVYNIEVYLNLRKLNKSILKCIHSSKRKTKTKQEKQTLAYYQMKKKLQRMSFKRQKRYGGINKKTMKNRNLTKYYGR